jgi:hypothetical protein
MQQGLYGTATCRQLAVLRLLTWTRPLAAVESGMRAIACVGYSCYSLHAKPGICEHCANNMSLALAVQRASFGHLDELHTLKRPVCAVAQAAVLN